MDLKHRYNGYRFNCFLSPHVSLSPVIPCVPPWRIVPKTRKREIFVVSLRSHSKRMNAGNLENAGEKENRKEAVILAVWHLEIGHKCKWIFF